MNMTGVTGMKIRTLMRNSALTRARRADLRCPDTKDWRGRFTLLLVFGVTLITFVTPAAAQLPDFPGSPPSDPPNLPEPQPQCVSCGPGYHCVHDPEGCEPDEDEPPPEPEAPIEQPE